MAVFEIGFHDYLYGSSFAVITDNNHLTYVYTTAKVDATGQRWVASLSGYNFTVWYRNGKNNADADGLSRRQEAETDERAISPKTWKAFALSASVMVEKCLRSSSISIVGFRCHTWATASSTWPFIQRMEKSTTCRTNLEVYYQLLWVGNQTTWQMFYWSTDW